MYAEGKGDTCGTIIFGVGADFRCTFCIYLGTFFEVGGDAGAIGPVCAFHPDRFIFLIALGIFEFLGVGHVEVDHILAIHRIGDTIFSQVADYLELYHNAIF